MGGQQPDREYRQVCDVSSDEERARGVSLFNLNSMETGEIEAIEVYTGVSQIPAKYNKTSGGCGVMLIWTRVGNRE
jgi:hypothetical protein